MPDILIVTGFVGLTIVEITAISLMCGQILISIEMEKKIGFRLRRGIEMEMFLEVITVTSGIGNDITISESSFTMFGYKSVSLRIVHLCYISDSNWSFFNLKLSLP